MCTKTKFFFFSIFVFFISSHNVEKIKERLEGVTVTLDKFSFIVSKQEKLISVRKIFFFDLC